MKVRCVYLKNVKRVQFVDAKIIIFETITVQ